MSLSPAGEASVVTEKRPKSDRPATRATAKAAKTPAAKPAATPRKRTPPAKRPWPVVEPVVEAVVEPVTEPIAEPVTEAAVETVIDLGPEPAAPLRAERPRRRHGSGLARGAVVLVAVAAAAALVIAVRWDSSPEPTRATPVAMSPANLLSLAESRDTPIYWAGPFAGRELELTTTTTGTFVRYLPAGATSGNTKLALTIATYPLQGAYATAVQQANEKGMTSEQTENGGLAVWRASKPTSVYVAFRGVPSLVEVYAPAAKEARTLALSGRIKPVR